MYFFVFFAPSTNLCTCRFAFFRRIYLAWSSELLEASTYLLYAPNWTLFSATAAVKSAVCICCGAEEAAIVRVYENERIDHHMGVYVICVQERAKFQCAMIIAYYHSYITSSTTNWQYAVCFTALKTMRKVKRFRATTHSHTHNHTGTS